ncbi:YheC/YheD family protein [Mesobacillus campisalis]|uniref:YheC/YheD family endospore coat-associated protein n=1 Tax=Mesobacillus campisalis TaxID=1408103 RepID=UPI00069BD121|nr:YheC/YheD family protein [Mesobacillus campisalis]
MDQLLTVQPHCPIMAVLTEIEYEPGMEPSFGSIHDFCFELQELFTSSGWFFYVFSLKGFAKNGITGLYHNGSRWTKAKMPFPDLVYNRIHSRRSESGQTFIDFVKIMSESHIPVFNRRFLNKWEVHQWLYASKKLQRFLPESCVYSRHSLQLMAESHEVLFLKPINGSRGRDIIRIQRQGSTCHVSLSSRNGIESLTTCQKEELHAILKGYLKKQLYLLQQGLPLLRMDKRSVDFRILCNRSSMHDWRVTSTVARLSAQGHFAANLAVGGDTIHPLRILRNFFGEAQSTSRLDMIRELALEAANCTADSSGDLFAELGIDVGIDDNGHPWIIEVNSKPSKNDHIGKNSCRPSAKAIAEYAQILLSETNPPEEGGSR